MATRVEEGQKAPAFNVPASTGESISLKSLEGKNVVLFFYPKDNTPGCTKEACGFRDSYAEIERLGAVVLGASRDGLRSHDKFVAKHELNFPLLSDEDGSLTEDYGVWVEKSMYGKTYMGIERSTFLIDGTGKIRKIWRKVKVPGHVEEVVKALEEIG